MIIDEAKKLGLEISQEKGSKWKSEIVKMRQIWTMSKYGQEQVTMIFEVESYTYLRVG